MESKKFSTKKPTAEEAHRKMIFNSCYGVEPYWGEQYHWKRIVSPGASVLIRISKIKKILSKI